MLDTIRDGLVNPVASDIPQDPQARADHLKAFGYFNDASMMGCGPLPPEALLDQPRRNPDIDRLAHALKTRQTKTLASGIDVIMADLKESMEAAPRPMVSHRHALVFLYEHNRDPNPDEPGSEWIMDAQDHRACLLGDRECRCDRQLHQVVGVRCAGAYGDVDRGGSGQAGGRGGFGLGRRRHACCPMVGPPFWSGRCHDRDGDCPRSARCNR